MSELNVLAGSGKGNVTLAVNSAQFEMNPDTGELQIKASYLAGLGQPVGSTYIQYYGLSTPATLYGGTWEKMYDNNAVSIMTEGAGSTTYEAETFDGVVRDSQMQGHYHGQNKLSSLFGYANTGGTFAVSTIEGSTAAQDAIITNPTTDSTNGTPRTGKATKPRRVIVRIWKRTA